MTDTAESRQAGQGPATSAEMQLCPMCNRVGYPVSDCPTCNKAVYCSPGDHTIEDGRCRYCDVEVESD